MRAIVLVDGEHYPPVTIQGIEAVRGRGYDVVAAVMLGGVEKLKGALTLGDLPVVVADTQAQALTEAVDRYEPNVVVDLSDAPVVDLRARSLLASMAMARDIAYHGAGFALEAPSRPRLSRPPTIAVIGTGKRTGKTAVSAALARRAKERGIAPVVVAMGRGGPAEPVVVRGDELPPSPETLLALADAGEHAASDVYEDAVVAGVMAVGARRAGAGLSGEPYAHTVHEAIEVANGLPADLLILEGSGTAIPPAHADGTVLVAGGGTPAGEILYGLGPYRVLIADLVVVTMAEEPVLSTETLSALHSLITGSARDVPLVRTVFRPTPTGPVKDRRIYLATTAPRAVADRLREHLTTVHGASVAGITHALSDRSRLTEDLAEAEGSYEVLLTEVKAAAIDVAVRAARRAGADVVFADNVPLGIDADLVRAFDDLLDGVIR